STLAMARAFGVYFMAAAPFCSRRAGFLDLSALMANAAPLRPGGNNAPTPVGFLSGLWTLRDRRAVWAHVQTSVRSLAMTTVDQMLADDFGTIGDMIAIHAAARPGHPALVMETGQLTYGELDRLMDRIGAAL